MSEQQIDNFVNRLTTEGIVTDAKRLREETQRQFGGGSGTDRQTNVGVPMGEAGGQVGMGARPGRQARWEQGVGGAGFNYPLPRADRPNNPTNYNYIDPIIPPDWVFSDPLLPLANLSGQADQLPIPLSHNQSSGSNRSGPA